MLVTVGIIIIIVLSMAQFYLKCSVLTAFMTMISAVFALIGAFNYYEILAYQFISRGHGGQWAQPLCFIFTFVFVFALIRAIPERLIATDIHFGVAATRITTIVCSIVVGIIFSGVLLIAIAMTPTSPKWPYRRFGEEGRELTLSQINNPNKAFLNADSLTAGLFTWMSKGSLSSSNSFGVYHADFIDQLHLNRQKAKEQVCIISGNKAVVVPAKYGVRTREMDERQITLVRMGISVKEISDGGAMDSNGNVAFTLSQVRLICKKQGQASTTTGGAKAIYPGGCLFKRQKKGGQVSLDKVITAESEDFERGSYGRVAWFDILFDVPSDMTAVLLEFKQNAIAELPRPVVGTDEIERQLDNPESKENTENTANADIG